MFMQLNTISLNLNSHHESRGITHNQINKK